MRFFKELWDAVTSRDLWYGGVVDRVYSNLMKTEEYLLALKEYLPTIRIMF